MSQKSNKKPVKKAHTTEKIGTKKQYRNILPLTDENLNVLNSRNDRTSESYNSSNSSHLNDDDSDDDAETVNTNYDNNPYGLTTPQRVNHTDDEMDVDDYEPCATELLTRKGKKMCYNIDGNLIPVTSATYKRDMTIYDINSKIIPKEEHLPENILNDDIMEEEEEEEDVKIGGKRQRKNHRKTHRKTLRKTKRKTRKTRRHRRRHTRKYK